MTGIRLSRSDGRLRAVSIRRSLRRVQHLLPAPVRDAMLPPREEVIISPADGDRFSLYRVRREAVEQLGVFVGDDGVLARAVADARRSGADPQPQLVWMLPADAVLRVPVALPRVAQRRLAEVLRLEVDRYTPFPPEEVHFDYRVLRPRSDEQSIDVELWVVRRTNVEAARQSAGRLGVVPSRIDCAVGTAEPGRPLGLHFGDGRRPRRRVRRTVLANGLLAGAVVALLATLLLQIAQGRDRHIAALTDAVTALQPAASEARVLRSRLAELAAADRRLQQRFHARGAVTGLLAGLSERLPESAWVRRLDLRGQELRLSGVAEDPAALTAALRSGDLLRRVRLQEDMRLRDAGMRGYEIEAEVRRRAQAPPGERAGS